MTDPHLYCANPVINTEVERLLGPTVAEFLRDRRVQEISANHESVEAGVVFVDYGDGPMHATGIVIRPGAIKAVTRMLATVNGKSLDPLAPFLTCVLACGARIHAVLPPATDGPSMSIRTHQRVIRALTDFATAEQVHFLKAAILAGKNIIVSGATNSGKTTLLNALIALIPVAERLAVVEDEPELQVRKGNVIRRHATSHADMKRHVFEVLCDRPDRIIVGEVRGPEAFDMLDAFRTGHSGGFATVHASSAAEALERLADLAKCGERLVRQAIDIVLFIQRMPDGHRAVTQIKEIEK
jgi:type IV secretion system protein VirB11